MEAAEGSGLTAFLSAVVSNQLRAAMLLAAYGCNTHCVSDGGKNALEYAQVAW